MLKVCGVDILFVKNHLDLPGSVIALFWNLLKGMDLCMYVPFLLSYFALAISEY